MLKSFNTKTPKIHESVYLSENTSIIGDVTIGENSSVWFNAVIRGDVGSITIGMRTNVQDGSILHMLEGENLIIGDDVTIGHRAIVHNSIIGNRVLVGMGAVIMDKTVIGDDSIIAAGAVVTEGVEIPPKSLVVGIPAKVKRTLSDEELTMLPKHAKEYAKLAKKYNKARLSKVKHGEAR